jgi:hypothetical protein
MVQMDSRHAAIHSLDCPALSHSTAALHGPFPGWAGEQSGDCLPSGDGAEGAIAGWDSLWVDLGGEG